MAINSSAIVFCVWGGAGIQVVSVVHWLPDWKQFMSWTLKNKTWTSTTASKPEDIPDFDLIP